MVDSRGAEEGSAIRRRRICSACGYRFTTFERLESRPLRVRKRGGQRVAFERPKLEAGLLAATKGRPVPVGVLDRIVAEIEALARGAETIISTEEIGRAVLERLRAHDHVSYLRFASVYKGFDDVADFERELRLLDSGSASDPG